MAAPIAKGLIITASILVAAGIACYENEHIREWILSYRRKLAIALHSLGDEINPPSRSRTDPEEDTEEAAEARRQRRQEIIRLNRLEMLRQAKEEGIAVDLDELERIGEEAEKSVITPTHANSGRSFDELVGADGMLRQPEMAQTTGIEASSSGLRQRNAGARGLDLGAAFANPFGDEAQVLFDQDVQPSQTRESSRTLSPSAEDSQYFSEDEMAAQIEEAIRRSLSEQGGQSPLDAPILDQPASEPSPEPASLENSFYYAPPPQAFQPPANAQSLYSSAMEAMLEANLQNPSTGVQHDDADDEAHTPSGTLTPTEDGQSTAASFVGSQAEDVARMSDFQSIADEHDFDARSEATSEAFSEVGVETPHSWTDVESEADEEEGHQSIAPVVVNR